MTKKKSAARAAGVSYATVVRLGLTLPDVAESTSYGTPALKANGNLMTRLWEDGQTLVMKTTFEERDALMVEAPETYYITDHYLDYPYVLIRLPKADADALNDLLHSAHRIASSEKRRPRKKAARKRQ
jgi:hypothetical protein